MNYNNEYEIINMYAKEMHSIISHLIPTALDAEVYDAINYAMSGKMKNGQVYINNHYKDKVIETNLLDIIEYILKREPIFTPFGVMFKRTDEEENILVELTIKKFLRERKLHKKEMFKYPEGSELFNKYNLLQLLSKVDARLSIGVFKPL